MRGKDSLTVVSICFLGITPAYAGKSAQQYDIPQGHRDHPRVCGEKGLLRHLLVM